MIVNVRFRAGKDVFAAFADAHVPYAVVKGAVLSKRIYGNETARFSGDIDLIIPRAYADTVKSCFLQNGFTQGRVMGDTIVPFTRSELVFHTAKSHQLAPFVRESGNPLCPFVNYDVNIELFWGESDMRTDMETFLFDTLPITVGGITVQSLPPEKEFIALCLHHYKDWNSVYLLAEKGFPLSHFFDIYGYLLIRKPDPEKLRVLSDQIGATKYVYFCVRYAHDLFGQPCTAPYLHTLHTPEGENLISTYGLDEADRRLWNIPFVRRVFDSAFLSEFEKELTDPDRKKILMNRTMM